MYASLYNWIVYRRGYQAEEQKEEERMSICVRQVLSEPLTRSVTGAVTAPCDACDFVTDPCSLIAGDRQFWWCALTYRRVNITCSRRVLWLLTFKAVWNFTYLVFKKRLLSLKICLILAKWIPFITLTVR